MTRLPRLGQRVRDAVTGDRGKVVQILADSGPAGVIHIVIQPDGQRTGTRTAMRMVALQDVEALH